jgi:hypothetical protein
MLTGRKVNTFRCQVDPMVGPKPRNAFVPSTMGMEAELMDHGVYVKVMPYGTFTGSEHLIPFANIQSIRLEPEAESEMKRKPGRPVGS